MTPEPGTRYYHKRTGYRVTIADLPDYSGVTVKGEHDANDRDGVAFSIDDEFDGEKYPVLRTRPLDDFLAKFSPYPRDEGDAAA